MTKNEQVLSEINASFKKICEILEDIPFHLEFDMETNGEMIFLNGVFVSKRDFKRFQKRFHPIISKSEHPYSSEVNQCADSFLKFAETWKSMERGE